MRVAFYSQHVLGVGHLFRSLEIVRALERNTVSFITGGAELDLPLPAHAQNVRLPGVMMDSTFSHFIPMGDEANLDTVFTQRKNALMEHLQEFQPHIFFVELFPFGRKKFGVELLPVLEKIRAGSFGPCKVICSLRDILVEKKQQKAFEERVTAIVNTLFDMVLIHGDPQLVRLEETFPATKKITTPMAYTGYVASAVCPQEVAQVKQKLDLQGPPLVVASAGGGSVGQELLHKTLAASAKLARKTPHKLILFTGPYAPKHHVEKLKTAAKDAPHSSIHSFTNRFLSYLSAATLSVSLAGYNTTMNLLSAPVHGLVLPFDQNHEQRLRAEKLQKYGALTILDQQDLAPAALAQIMKDHFTRSPVSHGIDLSGAKTTARLVEELTPSP